MVRRMGAAVCLMAMAGWVVGGAAPQALAAQGGFFVVQCPFTGTALAVDPVVAYGVHPTDHKHIFFGNTRVRHIFSVNGGGTSGALALTDANLSVPAGRKHTSCGEMNDTAVTWFPQVFVNGSRWTRNAEGRLIYVRTYYVTLSPAEAEAVHFIPDQVQMVNGDPMADAPPSPETSLRDVYWDCGAGNGHRTPRSQWPYRCALPVYPSGFRGQDGVVLHVNFPHCFDPSREAPNGSGPHGEPQFIPPTFEGTSRSDLVFDEGGKCPVVDDHGDQVQTVPIPRISVRLHFLMLDPLAPSSGWSGLASCTSDLLPGPPDPEVNCTNVPPQADDIAITFDSGPYFTAHADWMQTWVQGDPAKLDPDQPGQEGTLDDLVEDCLMAPLPVIACSSVNDKRPD